jgi:hypothetical protein
VQFAVNVPNFGEYADPATFIALAQDTEAAGWDALFVWDHILIWDGNVVADPWILLAAAAAATDRIRLGPMVTPLPRRRPWVVARQAVTLDHLSGGRVILGVGIGHPPGPEFRDFGEVTDERTRADMLDEGLAIITGMWSGDPFRHRGEHYRLAKHTFLPTPVQQPRIPIWVAGMWPNRRPFRRAARYDGLVPMMAPDGGWVETTPAGLVEMKSYVDEHRTGDDPYDVAWFGDYPAGPDEAAALVAELAAAGATWCQMGPDQSGDESAAAFRERVRRGPPNRE